MPNKIWPLLKNALSNLNKNKTRTFLTMLGMIIGVASVILLVAIGSGLRNVITDQFKSMGSNNLFVMPGNVDLSDGPASRFTNRTSTLKFKYLNSLTNLGKPISLVSGVTENITKAKHGSNTHTVTVEGGDENTLEIINMDLASGQNFSPKAIRENQKVAIIGQTVIDNLFDNSDPIGQQLSIGEYTNITVIGTLNEKGGGLGGAADMDNIVYIPYTISSKIFDKQAYDFLIFQVDSVQNLEAAKTKITHALLKLHLKPDEFTVIKPSEILATINSILGAVTLALGGIAGISLVVGGIGIMNIMLVSVTERVREIGLRKTVGATFHDILLLFLIEAVVISLLGGLLGILIAAGVTLIIHQFFQAQITLWSVLLAFSFSAVVGIVFGVAPAIKAARLNPIDALRYE